MLCGCVGLSEHVEDYSVGCGKCLPIYNWLVTGHPSLSLPFPKLGNWESLLSFPFSSPHPQGPQGPLIAVQGVLPWSPSSPTQPPSSQPEAMGAGGIPQSQLQKMEQRNQSRPSSLFQKEASSPPPFWLTWLSYSRIQEGRESDGSPSHCGRPALIFCSVSLASTSLSAACFIPAALTK